MVYRLRSCVLQLQYVHVPKSHDLMSRGLESHDSRSHDLMSCGLESHVHILTLSRAQERLERAKQEVKRPGAEKAAQQQELHKRLRVCLLCPYIFVERTLIFPTFLLCSNSPTPAARLEMTDPLPSVSSPRTQKC